MVCKDWNDDWIARLYDELDEIESRRLQEHLERCSDCRQTLERLDESRALLRSTIPEVPAPARVIVMPATGFRRPAWSFAAGIAATLLVFAAGLWAGRLGSDPRGELDDVGAKSRVQEHLEQLESQIEVLRTAAASASPGAGVITEKELDARIAGLERRFQTERTRDVEFLLGEISATEWRAANWVDENREALRLVALRNDPRLSER